MTFTLRTSMEISLGVMIMFLRGTIMIKAICHIMIMTMFLIMI